MRSTVGSAQFGLAVSASTTLTVPTKAGCAEIYVRTADITFTRDGTTPTATKGTVAHADDIIYLHTYDEAKGFTAINVAAAATLDVEYFTEEVN